MNNKPQTRQDNIGVVITVREFDSGLCPKIADVIAELVEAQKQGATHVSYDEDFDPDDEDERVPSGIQPLKIWKETAKEARKRFEKEMEINRKYSAKRQEIKDAMELQQYKRLKEKFEGREES